MRLLNKVRNFFKSENKDFKNYADCIVFDVFGNLLLVQRSTQDDFMPDKWALPGGKIEAGEQPIEAAARELYEETGIESIELIPFEVIDKADCTINYFMGYLSDNMQLIFLDNEEHYRYQFVSVDELDDYDLILDLGDTLKQWQLDNYAQGQTDGEQIINKVSFGQVQKAFDAGNLEEDDYLRFVTITKSLEIIQKGFEQNLVSEEKLVDSLQKAKHYEFVKVVRGGKTFYQYREKAFNIEKSEGQQDPSHGGKLIKVTRTTHTGKKTTKWVLPEEVDKEVEGAKKEGHDVDIKHKKLTDEELREHAKNSPEAALKETIANSGDPKLRKIAHEELDRRGKKEAVQEEKEKVGKGK